jgi:hypothetical protein
MKINQAWQQNHQKFAKNSAKNLAQKRFFHRFNKKCSFFSKVSYFPFGFNNNLKSGEHGVSEVVHHH